MGHEELQQPVLGGTHADLAVAVQNPPRQSIEHQLAGTDSAFHVGRAGAPQHRLDAGDQLPRGERLDDVVVGARVKAGDLVVLGDPGGEHDDGNVCRDRIATQAPGQFDPADTGHHPVHEDDVGPIFADRRERLAGIAGAPHGHAGAAQRKFDHVPDRGFIVHDEYVGRVNCHERIPAVSWVTIIGAQMSV